jgi:hypothetical protein
MESNEIIYSSGAIERNDVCRILSLAIGMIGVRDQKGTAFACARVFFYSLCMLGDQSSKLQNRE